MRRALLLLLITVLAAGVWHPTDVRSDDETKFKQIFDGKTLDGWKGEAGQWRVEEGAIVGEIPAGQRLDHNTWLVWEGGALKDFELRLEFRLAGLPAANSGIQFRCQASDAKHVSGYQADLDMGAKWLGRIYDEHGRALLVERGTRVLIEEDGERAVESFASASRYAALFRQNDWNDYRIRACDEHVTVDVNGTLFSELVDKQTGEKDLSGQLAFQLHAGPETRIEFRNIRLRELKPAEHRVKFKPAPVKAEKKEAGVPPTGDDGKALNLGFEDGTLKDWTASGTAFEGQPVDKDGIASRWPGQTSQKAGQYFIGGYETTGNDALVGQLLSAPFAVTHPFASFLVGGGSTGSTRVDLIQADAPDKVIYTVNGANREEMQRAVVDLGAYAGRKVQVRLVDESSGGWGHLNFDDFRFHATKPAHFARTSSSPLDANPILSQLVRNPAATTAGSAAAETVRRMHLPVGFTAEVIAAEPQLFQPIAFTFDARGRIWVVEGLSYPQKRPDGEGKDRILIFSDEDGDGQFESRKVFADGLNLVSGLEVGHGGVWVGAAPELLFIPDRDQDDQPDSEPQVLLNGFGFQDTHETLNSLVWGPDGWLYGNQGVFNFSRIGKPESTDDRVELRAGIWRYHPVRHEFEVFAHGGSNQWGLDFNEYGQLFMTHCRSRWGRGPTTHVIQGAHYWNQSNRNHADFVSPVAPAGYPFLRNFMLASARYGHGEGGAGKPGSRAVYGGHSHVGTMIYLGDNWPDEYRDHLFTHNLHGHQINHQVNRRVGSGFNTLHAGNDVFFCEDVQHVGVDLKYGPDGAVYTIDWYDERLCHNPNVEQWDRTNGRIYRIAYAESFAPVQVDLARLDDHALAKQLLHRNDWHVRTALRLLSERAAERKISPAVRGELFALAQDHADASRRLRGLWALHAVGGLDDLSALKLLQDANEFVRAWTIQLVTDDRQVGEPLQARFVDLARNDSSAVVRLYLASAMGRVVTETAWQIGEALSQRGEDSEDRNIPKMIWYGVAPLVSHDIDRAFRLAGKSQIPVLPHFVRWYVAKGRGDGLNQIIQMVGNSEGKQRRDLLEETSLALAGQHGVEMPKDWPKIADRLYQDTEPRTRRLAESLGAVFGDQSLYPRKRHILADRKASLDERRHAYRILSQAADPTALPLFLTLLDDRTFRSQTLLVLARYDEPEVGAALVDRFAAFTANDRTAALNTLTSRESWAHLLLDAVADGRIEKLHLSAYYVRQLSNLNSKTIAAKLNRQWGKVESSSAEKLSQIARLDKSYTEAPLWAYSTAMGKEHFKTLCSSCHRVDNVGTDVGPKIVGSGPKGSRYFVENVVDPNAVIGADFQTSIVVTSDGRVVSGLVEQSTDTAVTLLTPTNPPRKIVIPRSEIDTMKKTSLSLMPERMLESLNDRQVIELLKYLNTI
ncbi:MAG: DUF1080 domain-containing protein [Fuerstiella sp.]|nr:DUF1080 domain-containing protein [Fuerstiella sp.]MCP4857874.1 DUF1080 domain-containing protein [Fuerstiella sp.]